MFSAFITRDFETECGFDAETAEKGFDGEGVEEVVAWRKEFDTMKLRIKLSNEEPVKTIASNFGNGQNTD